MTPQVFGPRTDGFHDTENQVHDAVAREARIAFEADAHRKAALSSPAAVRDYQARMRARFLEAIGGLPGPRCPLAVRDSGGFVRPGYSVRKLIFQSLPDFHVTANLYRPEGGGGAPGPAVLMSCGHSDEGKAAPLYQEVCIRLVRAGFIVLIVDSPGQGEMVQCLDRATGTPRVGRNTAEHCHLQLQASILNLNIARYWAWNSIRALDLLCELPGVDPARIGATGNSGGGTQTQYAMMADPRVAAAMPCCSLSSRESYLDTGSRTYDGEQNLFGCIAGGLDYDDFLSCFAPRPVRIGAAAHDFFCIEGVLQSFERARRVYDLLGAGDRVDLTVAENEGHGFTPPLREACVDWFCRHLQDGRRPEDPEEPVPEEPALLRCTESGQVLTEMPGARSIVDLLRDAWNDVRGRRQDPGRLAPARMASALALPGRAAPLHVRRTHGERGGLGAAERLFFFSEPGVIVTAAWYGPAVAATGATLLLIPGGTEGQEPFRDLVEQRLAAGFAVLIPDVRGTGAVRMRSRTRVEGRAFRSTEFRVANDCFMLGKSLLAARVYDVLRALDALRARAGGAGPVELAAFGEAALYGLYAAVVEPAFSPCSFSGLPHSFSDVFTDEPIDPDIVSNSVIEPRLAGTVDIPDLLGAIRDGGRLADAEP